MDDLISIDDLPLAENLTENDVAPINQNQITKKVRFSNIKNLVWGDVLSQTRQVAESVAEGVVGAVASNLAQETQDRIEADQGLQDQINMITETDLGNLADLLDEKAPRIVGTPADSCRTLTTQELIRFRLLPLEYGVHAIADYPELIEKMYVGDQNNATALFWYKCRDDANKTRDINGTHFRAADWRGIFGRVAGQNAVLRTDMNNPNSPPYDGKQTGEFERDEQQPFYAALFLPRWETGNQAVRTAGAFLIEENNLYSSVGMKFNGNFPLDKVYINTENFLRTGLINKPPSMSENRYIHY